MLTVSETVLEEAIEVGLSVRNLLIVALSREQARLLVRVYLVRVHGSRCMTLSSRLFSERLLLGVLADFREGNLMLVHHLDPVATRAGALAALSFTQWFQCAAQRLRITLKFLCDVLYVRLLDAATLNIDEIVCVLGRSDDLSLFRLICLKYRLFADALFVTLDYLSFIRFALPANQVVTEHVLLLQQILIQVFLEPADLRLLLPVKIYPIFFADV